MAQKRPGAEVVRPLRLGRKGPDLNSISHARAQKPMSARTFGFDSRSRHQEFVFKLASPTYRAGLRCAGTIRISRETGTVPPPREAFLYHGRLWGCTSSP